MDAADEPPRGFLQNRRQNGVDVATADGRASDRHGGGRLRHLDITDAGWRADGNASGCADRRIGLPSQYRRDYFGRAHCARRLFGWSAYGTLSLEKGSVGKEGVGS